MNVQAVCDPIVCFTNIVCQWPGSMHDSRIFYYSAICAKFEHNEIEGILLGDSGYPCCQYIMTPLHDPTNNQEKTAPTSCHLNVVVQSPPQ